ncbi:beta strand repeat-containing protein [Dactylococcopsis salina]|uniref:Right handed beta helix domain-containing protein n=1 Tax=Dactylococcopsis salina (strain PCC 8305) TaxID=13035 RepID=K9YXF4_DACS8|nr:choice-of-anchor Q domain-containing protein [Dactylococcopsis salina]AFZ51172.1 hypothetical protein Dacsa_2585 [Dactylococcopsis salina PCC 8305]
MNDLIEALMLNGGTLINEFAQSNLFFSGLETAFGTDYEIETAATLQAMLTDGTFLDELGMEVLPSSALNGALGAYASATNTIYLSSALEGFSLEVTTAVFLEEVGHAVDAFLNTTDSAGDEGAIFSALVRGKPLSEEKLAGLRQEDDFSTIVVDGEEIIIEQATLTVDTETDENDGLEAGDGISLRDAIESIAPGGTITFADGINTITLDEALGELVIDKGLTIDGDLDDDGSPDVTVQRASDATAEFRIFNIDDGNDANVVTVTLDGLTISGGTVSGDGGGILNNENLTLSNSTVSGNSALFGGGIYNGYYYATANVTNSTVSGNFATGSGGGIFNYSGTANVTNSTVSGNSATNDAGGIYSGFDGIANITNSTISDNSATNGGGINSGFNGTANITNSTISDNFATGNGGGIYNNFATANVTNSTVSGNSATGNGGGIYNGNYGTANVTNSTVSGNSAAINGGGIYNYDGTANVTNSTLSGNSANSGGGIYNGYYSTANITNSIVANSVGNDLSRDTGTINASYSLIENNADQINGTNSNNITGQDPLLDPALQDNGGVTQTIALLADSPAIDAGDNNSIPAGVDFDQRGDGFDRIFNGTVDIGAFEVQLPPPTDLIVDTIIDEADGRVTDGDVSLRDALAVIVPGGTITFADGINTITLDEALGELVIDKGLTIDGDLDNDGSPDVTVQRASEATAEFRIFNIDDGNDANVVTVTLDGLTVTGGVASGSSPNNRGGGIFNNREDLTLTNSTVSGNSAADSGGGIYNYYGTANVTNSTVSGNSSFLGGGVGNNGTSTINNSTLSENSADFAGSGVFNYGTSTINNSTLSGNSADFGGGIYNNGTSTINNSTLSDNSAEFGGGVNNFGTSTINNSTLSGNSANSGGGIYNAGTANVTNSTVSGNSATNGGGIYNGYYGTANVTNSIVANSVGDDLSRNGGTINASYSLIENNADQINGTNSNNITGQDPLLDPALQDNGGVTQTIALLAGSPAIDAGDNDSIPTGVDFDQRGDGFDRIVNGTVDIGAFESLPFALEVDTETDENDGLEAGDGISLRDAIESIAPGGTITFADGINTITLDEALGELVIDKGLTIDGDLDDDGSPDVTVERASDATVDFRIFNINDGNDANVVTVTLDGLTVTGGVADGSVPNDRGGGISNREDLTLTNSIVSGNSAANYGGGIYNAGTANVTNSTVSGNSSYIGGGVLNYGTSTINNSTLSGNSADFGGGIYNYGTSTITINNSTLSGNSAEFGGGIYNGGTSTITNSTLSGNLAADGGGVYNKGTSTITNSTLSGNSADDPSFGGNGGGFFNGYGGTSTINNSTLSDNYSTFGGGIYNAYATLTINNSTLSSNSAFQGSGVYNYGTSTINNSTLSGNSADDGGGIYNSGTSTINNSTLSGNSADDYGGGVTNYGTLTIDNSTLSGNSAAYGGGIYNSYYGGTSTINNSTLSGNSADLGGGVSNYGTSTIDNSTLSGNSAEYGGGIYNAGTANVTNSTVSGNSAAYGGGVNNNGTANVTNSIVANSVGDDLSRDTGTINASYSLIENNADQINGTNTNNITGQDPLLDPAGLQDNGGPTQTIALVANSPAIDAGDNTLIPAGVDFDQRGTGFDRIVNGTVDIGAFESLPFALEVDTETDENDGLEAGDGISLRDAIESIAPGGTITFADGINTITLDEALGELVIDKGLTIDGDLDNDGSPDVTVQRASDATIDFRIFNINDGNDANAVTVTLDGLTVSGETVNNSGTVAVETGRLQFDAGYTQTAGLTRVAEVATLGGTLNIEGGTLQGNGFINGNVTMGGTFAPGNSVGEIEVRGDYNQTTAGTLEIEIGGVEAFDRAFIDGNVSLAGRLEVNLLDGFTPSLGETYSVLSANNIEGDFNRFRGLELDNGLLLQPILENNELVLSVEESRFSSSQDLGFGQTGVDVITGSELDNFEQESIILFTGEGNDRAEFATSSANTRNRLYGSKGNDELLVGSRDRAFGVLGNDILDATQGNGNNRLYGGDGQDQLFAGSGDILFGGNDADEFWVANNTLPETANIIGDFTPETDKIGLGSVNLSFDDLTFSDSEGDGVIATNNQSIAIVKNTAASLLDNPDHFLFT